jgi:hypothetical protein
MFEDAITFSFVQEEKTDFLKLLSGDLPKQNYSASSSNAG